MGVRLLTVRSGTSKRSHEKIGDLWTVYVGVAPPCWRDTAKSRASGAPILTRTGRLISPFGTVIGASRSSREHYRELQFLSADFWGASSYRTEMTLLTNRFLPEFLYFSRWLFQWAFLCDQKPNCGYISFILPKHDQRFWVHFSCITNCYIWIVMLKHFHWKNWNAKS